MSTSIILLFFWLYGLSIFAFCFMVSAAFSRARVASTVGAVIFLLSFFPFYAVSGDDVSSGNKGAACLSTNICFALGAATAIKFESAQQGITNANVNTELNNFRFGTTIGMFIFDLFFYMLLALYLERVVPSTYGISLKWNFCCRPSYWRKSCKYVPAACIINKMMMMLIYSIAAPGPATSPQLALTLWSYPLLPLTCRRERT